MIFLNSDHIVRMNFLFTRLPVRWDKSVIVVMNEVRVSSPYLPESVSGGTASANERVRKVVRLSESIIHFRLTYFWSIYIMNNDDDPVSIQLEFERKRMQTRGSGH